MLTHNVLIITSGRAHTVRDGSRDGSLDQLIRDILALKKNPILILGPDGDDLLRTTLEIESCEIIFDPNFTGDLFSSVKAGLAITQKAAFVVVLGEDRLPRERWSEIDRLLLSANPPSEHRLIPVTQSGAVVGPVLLTANGVRALRMLPASCEWASNLQISSCNTIINVSQGEIAPGGGEQSMKRDPADDIGA